MLRQMKPSLLLFIAFLTCSLGYGQTPGFTIDDQAMPFPATWNLVDHELDQLTHSLVMIEGGSKHVVVQRIDPITGDWLGGPVTVDNSGTAMLAPYPNGPEWANSANRDIEIYWNRQLVGGPMEVVRKDATVAPPVLVPGTSGYGPVLVSNNASLPYPIMLSVQGSSGFWREDGPCASRSSCS